MVLSSSGNKGLNDCSWNGVVEKAFDTFTKSYIYIVHERAEIKVPKDSTNGLALLQRYLVLQMYVFKGIPFAIEIYAKDDTGIRRRFLIASSKNIKRNQIMVRLPNSMIMHQIWNNVWIDVQGLMQKYFPERRLKAIDVVNIRGSCHLRRIFTMKLPVEDNTGNKANETYAFDAIPMSCEFPKNAVHVSQFLGPDDFPSAPQVSISQSDILLQPIQPIKSQVDITVSHARLSPPVSRALSPVLRGRKLIKIITKSPPQKLPKSVPRQKSTQFMVHGQTQEAKVQSLKTSETQDTKVQPLKAMQTQDTKIQPIRVSVHKKSGSIESFIDNIIKKKPPIEKVSSLIRSSGAIKQRIRRPLLSKPFAKQIATMDIRPFTPPSAWDVNGFDADLYIN